MALVQSVKPGENKLIHVKADAPWFVRLAGE